MRSSDDSAALLVLLRTGRRPWQQYAELVEAAGTATAVLAAEAEDPPDLFAAAAQADATAEADRRAAVEAATREIEQWRSEGIGMLTVLDADYPENLRMVHDRPPIIFVAGRLASHDARSVAVVGAREATGPGLASAAAVAEHLVDTGYTVVSGLASGIDTAAHTAALAHGGHTIAVIGTGLRRVYPPQNGPLQRRIASEGAVISQFWPDAPPSRRSFPMRNAVMSGLTLASVVVEAGQTSGSRIQARLALAHGRPVFLLRPLLGHAWARELAGRPGAHVVDTPAEITAMVARLNSSGTLVS